VRLRSPQTALKFTPGMGRKAKRPTTHLERETFSSLKACARAARSAAAFRLACSSLGDAGLPEAGSGILTTKSVLIGRLVTLSYPENPEPWNRLSLASKGRGRLCHRK
jgi:hypothetical protein